jgi:hypothetical protein
MVERHENIASELGLQIDNLGRVELTMASIYVTLEVNTIGTDLSERRKRKDLVSSGIREDVSPPVGESMKPA